MLPICGAKVEPVGGAKVEGPRYGAGVGMLPQIGFSQQGFWGSYTI